MPALAVAPETVPQARDNSPPRDCSPRTLVTVATYNEIENLPALVDAIWREVPAVDILVIDDNSPDGTGRWCDERAAEASTGGGHLLCVHRAGKLGLGTATIAAMQYAIEHGYDQVLNMDADFSHHPRYLPALLAAMEQADVAIGSRYCPGGGTKDWPWKRRMMSWGVNTYARCLLGLRPRDTSGAFRCYRVSLLKKLDFAAIKSRGYSFQEEILWRLKRLGARMVETPIVFADRERGVSKIDRSEALAALWIIFRLGLTNWLGI
ncbi:MAG: polyprenol monophosphomannose synthase [Pirellulaceae bacterium]|nr:polyprenol monophosphomannose synthase [Pirellulaceae bacterium]